MREVTRVSNRCIGAALVVAALGGSSQAHDAASGDVVPMLRQPPARLAGVTVQLRHTMAHQIVVENGTDAPLEVLDDDGVPFLRIGPAGAEANVASAAWHRTASAGDGPLPAGITSGMPRWVRVGSAPTWGWYDWRVRPDRIPVSHAKRDAGRPATVGRWTIPLRFGATPVALGGKFRFAPRPAGTFVARVTSGDQPFPDVHVRLVPGRVPALYLDNASTEAVTVLGDADEPFLRIGPEGTSANLSSPTWQRSGKAESTSVPTPVDPTAPPAWRRQSTAPRYAWIEFRAAGGSAPAPADSSPIRRRWRIPLVHGTDRATVDGVVEWVPNLGL